MEIKTKKKFYYKGEAARKTVGSRGIYIPPAYTNVMASFSKHKKLQAVATDKSGKLQYFYTKKHKDDASLQKWERMFEFVKKIPLIRKHITKMTKDNSENKEEVALGLGFFLMDTCNFRVGGHSKKTYGVSTLKNAHLKDGFINYVGKSGVINTCNVPSSIIKTLKNKYISNKPSAQKFNQTLLKFGNFTCKDFRSFKANSTFIEKVLHLEKTKISENMKEREDYCKIALAYTADRLHHSPAICKGSYIVPDLLTSYKNGELFKIVSKFDKIKLKKHEYNSKGEVILLYFLTALHTQKGTTL
jgi:DNA topoisomerase-1